jgi:hypothetical protein
VPFTTIPLPYGLRDVKITPYTNAAATTLAGSSIDLPNARTLSFSEAEDFEDLRGDDGLVTTRGKGGAVSWELENGGVSLAAVAAMYGGTVAATSGVSPNQINKFTKLGTDTRPFFQIEGQAISDSGGDWHVILHRCRATGDLTGEMADGAFWLTGASGVALPSLVTATLGTLYTFVQNETAITIT